MNGRSASCTRLNFRPPSESSSALALNLAAFDLPLLSLSLSLFFRFFLSSFRPSLIASSPETGIQRISLFLSLKVVVSQVISGRKQSARMDGETRLTDLGFLENEKRTDRGFRSYFGELQLGNRITRVICTMIAAVADRPPRNINLIDGTNAIGDDASVFPCLPRVRRTLEYMCVCVCVISASCL